MDVGVKILLDFVEGRLSAAAFEKEVYENPDVERVLSNDPNLSSNNYVGRNVYLWLLERNYSDPGDQLSIQGAVAEFLERNGIGSSPVGTYATRFDQILEAQPEWLRVDTAYLEAEILPLAGARQGKELVSWLRKELEARFRYASQPPRWVQSPEWPIGENGPLIFLGQIDLTNYFHDEGSVYVFHDPTSGICETITQVY